MCSSRWCIGRLVDGVTLDRRRGSGFRQVDFAAYFIVMMLVNHVSFSWIMCEFDYRVREGLLSFSLLRPIHPIHSDAADNVSSKLITMPVMLLTAAGLIVLFKSVFPSFLTVIGFVPGSFLRFWCVSSLNGLWRWCNFLDDPRFGASIRLTTSLVFSSQASCAHRTLSQAGAGIATVLPFRWIIGFPAELLLGKLTPVEALIGIGAQLVWLVVGVVFLPAVWRAGVRIYSAVGA